MTVAVVLQLIAFLTLDGREVYVNARHIVSVSEARDEDDPHNVLTGKVQCIVSLTNGKFITVAEACPDVRRRLEETTSRTGEVQ